MKNLKWRPKYIVVGGKKKGKKNLLEEGKGILLVQTKTRIKLHFFSGKKKKKKQKQESSGLKSLKI